MSYEIKADRTETFLFPPSLDDWVPPDHPVRFIAAFVESIDLPSLGFVSGSARTGRPRFSAELLVSVICYCYYSRIRSLRGMERACMENVALMWLTGRQEPDHNTIWMFFRDNRKAIRKLLKQSARVAADANLIGMILHAVDGTKIAAQASRRTALNRAVLERALARVDASIAEMEAQVDASHDNGLETYRLPNEMADAQARRKTIQESLAKLEEEQTETLQPAEPEARIMLCDKKKVFGYNAQAVTDSKAGIVVGQDVVNQETDHGILAKMIDQAKETTGDVAETTLADKGYSAAQDLAEARDKGYDVLVNLTRTVDPHDDEKPFHSSRFKYDPEKNQCVCPIGGVLNFQRLKNSKNGKQKISVFHCPAYNDCPHRWECSKNKRGRTIELSEHHLAIEEQRLKQKDPAAKAKLTRRGVIVEPTFAFAKDNLGFRRWTLRTLEGVKTQWALICTVINLHKLYAQWLSDKDRFALP